MRPRYALRSSRMTPGYQVVQCIDGFDDGVPVTFTRPVAEFGSLVAARNHIDRLNGTAEGLNRIGVAVAVWAGMAQTDARYESAREFYMAEIRRVRDMYLDQYGKRYRAQCAADRAKADLAAERARRRKWELRLRWRHDQRQHRGARAHSHSAWPDDLLHWRAVVSKLDGRQFLPRAWRVRGIGFDWQAKRRPIAGPRGVLP